MFYLLLFLYLFPIAFLIGVCFGLVLKIAKGLLRLVGWSLRLSWRGVIYLFQLLLNVG